MALRIQADKHLFKELHDKAMPVAKIAERLFVSRDTVYRYLKADQVVFDPKRAGKKKKEAIAS